MSSNIKSNRCLPKIDKLFMGGILKPHVWNKCIAKRSGKCTDRRVGAAPTIRLGGSAIDAPRSVRAAHRFRTGGLGRRAGT
ncbi:unnamed protein product [Nesidiocoris tenuis]|uniref:Uncharacterized protein n=1 Tax=Nesidiocoris tenuis TaxID=355587 RepID=A0A6H5FV98_9HEMI|nr:unnamed protein product [Nesidiocoris tenuis]